MLTRIALICFLLVAIGFTGCSRGNNTPPGDGGKSGGTSLADITKAAENGDAQAQLKLGKMYRYGNGTSRNAEEAVKWLRKSAEQGNIEAMSQLYRAGLYPNGPDTPFLPDGRPSPTSEKQDANNPLSVDKSEAMSWLKKAADKGDSNSLFFLGHQHEMAKDMQQARTWYEKAASKGHADAEFSLAILLLPTNTPISNPKEGLTWLKKAANKGHAEAQVALGDEYNEGVIVTKDAAEARKWYEKAAAQGNEQAQQKVGLGTSPAGPKTKEQTYSALVVEAKKEAEKSNRVVLLDATLPYGGEMVLSPDGTTYHTFTLTPFSLPKSFWINRLKADSFSQVKDTRIGSAVYPALHRWVIRCSDGDLVFLGDYYNDKDGERYVTKFLQFTTKR